MQMVETEVLTLSKEAVVVVDQEALLFFNLLTLQLLLLACLHLEELEEWVLQVPVEQVESCHPCPQSICKERSIGRSTIGTRCGMAGRGYWW